MSKSTDSSGDNFPQYTAYNSYLANELRKLDQDVSVESSLIDTVNWVELCSRQMEIDRTLSYTPVVMNTLNILIEHPDDQEVCDGCSKMLASFGIVDTEGLVKDVWEWLKGLFVKIKDWISDFFKTFFGKTVAITPAKERAHKEATVNIMDETKAAKLLTMKIDNGYAFNDIDKLRKNIQQALLMLNNKYGISDIADMFIDTSDPNPQKRTAGGMLKIEYFIPTQVNGTKKLQDLGWVPSHVGTLISDTVPFMKSTFFSKLSSTQKGIEKELKDTIQKINTLKMNPAPVAAERQKLEEAAKEAKVATDSLSKIAQMTSVMFRWTSRLVSIVNGL